MTFLHFGRLYWIRHLEFPNFDFTFGISDLENPLVPSFIRIKWHFCITAIFNPPFWISKFRLQIRNQWPRKPPNTEFHPNQVTFLHFFRRYTINFFYFLHSRRCISPPFWIFTKGHMALKSRHFNENFKPWLVELCQKLKWAGEDSDTRRMPHI